MNWPRNGRPAGLASRLLAAQLLVIATAGLTLALVAAAAGPAVFDVHVRDALGIVSPEVSRHLREAFAAAGLLSLAAGMAAALLAALAVSLLATRRLAGPLHALTAAAARVAAGNYATRLPKPGLGIEFDSMAGAFNSLAATLQATESTRRRLLADLAHELRTPLATLDAYLEGLADGVAEPTTATWALLAEQTARMRRLAEDIALVSRAEEGQLPLHPQPVDLVDLAAAAVRAAAPRYRAKRVELDADEPPRPVPIIGDPDRLTQILANLLDNALRHTPAGGRVTVAVTRADRTAELRVTDTGGGIPAKHLPHVFDRFYRGDAARDRGSGGSGIGLTISRALARAHGGDLTATSPGPGAGATFTLFLPAD